MDLMKAGQTVGSNIHFRLRNKYSLVNNSTLALARVFYAMAKKKRRTVLKEYSYYYDGPREEDAKTLPANEQQLEVHIEKKHRGGKTAVLIKGFVGQEDDLKDLAKKLKQQCGVGGSAKNGEIIIQGDVRKKVMLLLEKWDYKVKRVGG